MEMGELDITVAAAAMDMSFANQALCVRHLWQRASYLAV